MKGNSQNEIGKRKVFRKELVNYKLDSNNRLLFINPLKNDKEKEILYKIPYEHEKDIIVKQAHNENNHCGRINE